MQQLHEDEAAMLTWKKGCMFLPYAKIPPTVCLVLPVSDSRSSDTQPQRLRGSLQEAPPSKIY